MARFMNATARHNPLAERQSLQYDTAASRNSVPTTGRNASASNPSALDRPAPA